MMQSKIYLVRACPKLMWKAPLTIFLHKEHSVPIHKQRAKFVVMHSQPTQPPTPPNWI